MSDWQPIYAAGDIWPVGYVNDRGQFYSVERIYATEKPKMEEWQQRVVREADELGDKIIKLAVFTADEKFKQLSGTDQHLLTQQLAYMNGYIRMLNDRIARFK